MALQPRLFTLGCALVQLLVISAPAHAARHTPAKKTATLNAAAANNAAGTPILTSSAQHGAAVLRVQILLDRAHFSPGEIDGRYGSTTSGAAAAFNLAKKIKARTEVNAATWQALNLDTAPVIVPYTLTTADLAGPFAPIPEAMAEKAKLPAMGYENAAEGLGEKFHVSPKLLAALNPGVAFDRAGTVIQVPNVARPPLDKIAGMTVRVSR